MSGESLYKDAEKKISGFFFKNYDKAEELFGLAASKYKMEKNYAAAGDAYTRAGDCAIKNEDTHTAGQHYADAASAYRKVNTKKAQELLELAVKMKLDSNRLSDAARLIKEFADALVEQGDTQGALPFYERAMKYFDADDQKAQSQRCMIALGEINAERDDFNKALMYLERVANNMLGGPLKFQAQDFFLKAMLCRLAMVTNDNRMEKSAECEEALSQYTTTDMYMKNTREEEFLQLILEAVTDNDADKFERGVSLLQDIRKLDDWKTHVLLCIKHNMESIN